MAIGAVKDNGNSVEIYDENGSYKASIWLIPGDSLAGYTGSSVSIKKENGSIEIYNEDGQYQRTIW